MSSHLSFEERLRQCLDQESLLKLDILSRKKHLSDLFLEQVQNPDAQKRTFTEEEFWRNNEAAIIDEIGQSHFQQFLKFKFLQNPVSGLENRPILFIPEQNIKENVPDLKINKAQAQRLIYEFADLRQAYESKPNRQSEEEFWSEFLKMNNKYQTIVFGGNNPLFIPGVTDEMKYDEVYVNENFQSLDEPAGGGSLGGKAKKLAELAPDVNFIKNLQDGRSSPRNEDGYGTYRKKYDADAFQAIHRDCDNDKALIKMKD